MPPAGQVHVGDERGTAMSTTMQDFSLDTGLKIAGGYSRSANILMKHCGRTRDSGVIHSLVVLRALALEVYLWCLYSLDRHKDYDGHDLKRRYDALSEESRERIRQYYHDCLEASPFITHVHAKHRDIKGHVPRLDFEHVLKEWANAFEEWRYFYEAKHKVVFLAYGEMEKALLLRIRDLRPAHPERAEADPGLAPPSDGSEAPAGP